MPIIRFDEENKTKNEGLPWLADWLDEHPTNVGATFQIIKVTPSSKGHYIVECYTESSDGFIATAFKESKAHKALDERFPEFKKENVSLYVEVTNVEWGKWNLTANSDKKCTWTKKGKGFTCDKAVAITPPTQK